MASVNPQQTTIADDIRRKLEKGDLSPATLRKMEDLLLELDTYIESYNTIVNEFHRRANHYTKEMKEYCLTRNMLSDLYKKQGAKNGNA
jgi:DNA repair ATPase RecN